MKKVLVVVGTRPNFIKITQFKKEALKFPNLEIKILHTGQHFDANMSDIFFEQFNTFPDYYLNAEKGRPAFQMASIIEKLDTFVNEVYRPDLILVPGDVNSTLASAIVANKNNISLGHIESGLRSYDRTMPEEHNRILTDQLSDHCFVTEPSGMENLAKENSHAQIHYVGNTMIDTLAAFEKQIIQNNKIAALNLSKHSFVLVTMHRPNNVDNNDGIAFINNLLLKLSEKLTVVFPAHPRTVKNFDTVQLKELQQNKNIHILEPLGYFEFQNLVKNAKCIVTDSGGIQEETTYLQIPCLTIRPNTERPITTDSGTNTLIPNDIDLVLKYVQSIIDKNYKKGTIPELWDGKATQRILAAIDKLNFS